MKEVNERQGSPDVLPAYQWNHRIHQDWAGERLFYWRLAFAPTYHREEIRTRLLALFREHAIGSYFIYEVFGTYDFVLRIWLPPHHTEETFEFLLRAALSDLGLQLHDNFEVTGNPDLHWVWQDGDGLREPAPEKLSERLPSELIDRINRRDLTRTEFDDLAKQNIIGKSDPTPSVVKFFVVVTNPVVGLPPQAFERLRRRLARVLLSVPSVVERSLYHGKGFGRIVMVGAIPAAEYPSITQQILVPTNLEDLFVDFRMRCFTYVCTESGYLDFSDTIPDTDPADRGLESEDSSVEALLEGGETANVEVKGSALVNIDRYLRDGTEAEDDRIINEGFLRTIVGMLNSRQGGVLVVGALEQSRYSKSEFATPDYPVIGDFILIGLALDLQERGFDWYERHLRDFIGERIRPDPEALVRIVKHGVRGRELCVVTVTPPEYGYFYLRDRDRFSFYARVGNRTKLFEGIDADFYKMNIRAFSTEDFGSREATS